MTHYLRQNGHTIVDVEATPNDISSVVSIVGYTCLFLSNPGLERQKEIMHDFHGLQELRGEYWETPNQQETPDELAERRLREIGIKYDLAYVTD